MRGTGDRPDGRRFSDEEFRAFVELAPDAVVLVDGGGTVLLANAQVEAMFGYDRRELLGQRVEVLLPERYRAAHIAHRERYLAAPRTRPMGAGLELRGRRRDGSEFPVDISISPLPTAEGMIVAAAIRDITERKRLEQARDQFIAAAAHELRTPFATLVGIGDTLADFLDEMSTEEVRASLAALKRQGERAATLVANLLDLSRLDSGRAEVELVPTELRTAVERALDTVTVPAGRSLEVDLPDSVRVLADPIRLEQVVLNLLTNALRYGGPHVTVSVSGAGTTDRTDASQALSARVRLVVEDDGPGIDAALRDRLFEPFTRGPAAGAVGGSGLGLALSRRLVEAFGGTLTHESRSEGGARFVVSLRPAA